MPKRKPTYTVRVRRQGDWVVAKGVAHVGPDFEIACSSRVSQRAVKAALDKMQGGMVVGGIFDDIGEFLGDAAGTVAGVAKDIAESDVFRKVANTLQDPRFQAVMAVVPGVGPAGAHGMANVGTAMNGLRSAVAQKTGLPELASQISMDSAAVAQQLGIPPEVFNAAQQFGANLADPTIAQHVLRRAAAVAPPPVKPPPHAAFASKNAMYARMLQQYLRQNPDWEHWGTVFKPSAPVAEFQRRVNLPVSGRVDDATRQRSAALGFPLPSPPKRFDSEQHRVASLVRLYLINNRDDPAAFGAPGRPSAPIQRAQAALGLPMTGYVDGTLRSFAQGLGVPLPAAPAGAPIAQQTTTTHYNPHDYWRWDGQQWVPKAA